VVDGPEPPKWQAHVVELLNASNELTVTEVRIEDRGREGRVWRSHRAVERRLFSFDPDPLAPSDLAASRSTGATPDLVVWLASTPAPDDQPLIELRYGPNGEQAERAFRRAAAEADSVVDIEAVLRRPARPPVVVTRSVAAVRPFSIGAGLNLALWRSAVVAARAAERAADAREPVTRPVTNRPAPAAVAIWRTSLSAWVRVLVVRLFFRRPWSILVRERGPEPFGGWGADAGLVRWKPNHFYADPFLLERGGRHHLFCEEIAAGSIRGVISHVELVPGGVAGSPVEVLSAPHHLSYPFVFEHDGDVFMVPETAAALRVELYRAVQFPTEWELDSVLLEGVRAADGTLFFEEDRWWMYVTIGGLGTTLTDELHLYSADSLRGPWAPHPQNPLVSDVRSARPAGGVLREGGKLIRPAQDCSRRYGWALTFRQVTTLTPSSYEERQLARLEPRQITEARAVHHYSRDSRYEAIDVRRRVRRFSFRRGEP
jgi:hypothetical protein